ncbi:MAG: AAA domain-containing protein [Holophagales bacterium]|nr:AAA domain-containing protein [Holophagales bacterium]MYH25769.1 AAA domain-containing protein [Holophagales bacterium]
MPVPEREEFLLPVLRALESGRETHASDIQERVAGDLGLSEADREERPKDTSPHTKLVNYVAWAFSEMGTKRASGAGLLTEGTRPRVYCLTSDGADLLATSPSRLTRDWLRKNYPKSKQGKEPRPATALAALSRPDSDLDLRAAWELAGKRIEDDEEAPQRIAARQAMLEEVKAWLQSERSSPEFMKLLWYDQRVLGDMGSGEYDLTSAIADEQFRANVATVVGTPLPEDRHDRVKALEQVAEKLMELARPHTVRVGGSGKGDKPIIQTWRLMTAVFPHDLLGARASGVNPAYDLVVLFRALGGLSASTAAKHRWLLDRLAEVAGPGSGLSANDGLNAVSRRMEQVRELYRIVSEDESGPSEPLVDPEPDPTASYSMADAMKDLFLPKRRFRDILNSIRSHRNLILQGPPGVGKTFIAKRIAWSLIGRKDDSSVETVQFHQSYAYEDFVQGFRPTETGGFRRRDGVFFEFCKRAENDLETPHIFIIDEINRGNLSRIFGELLMLLETDKRGPRHAVRLTYQEANESFSVPRNVYLLGLMNTADRSLAVVDHALRRRFAFEELEPRLGRKFQNHLQDAGAARDLIDRIVEDLEDLNQAIRGDDDLGHGFEIGHSYFVPQRDEKADENWRRHRVRSQILPLLREYWFDRRDEVEKREKRLLDLPDGD